MKAPELPKAVKASEVKVGTSKRGLGSGLSGRFFFFFFSAKTRQFLFFWVGFVYLFCAFCVLFFVWGLFVFFVSVFGVSVFFFFFVTWT